MSSLSNDRIWVEHLPRKKTTQEETHLGTRWPAMLIFQEVRFQDHSLDAVAGTFLKSFWFSGPVGALS